MNYLEGMLVDIEEKHDGQVMAQRKASDRISKIKYNFETIVYLR